MQRRPSHHPDAEKHAWGRCAAPLFWWRVAAPLALLLMLSAAGFALGHERGTVIRPATVYGQPNRESSRLERLERGRETVILDRIPGWVHVIATLPATVRNPDPEAATTRNVTGWVEEKNYIAESTAKGDEILFAEAVACEDEASQEHARRGAALDAEHLYYRVYDLFPKAALAGEALYRAADIQWQIDRADIFTRASRRGGDLATRAEIDETAMRLVRKKFPGTRWAELAEYQMLDNKICTDWNGASKCPEKEAEVYQSYAGSHPGSSKAAEAQFNAAYRWAALISIYLTEGRPDKVAEAKKRALEAAHKLLEKNASPEWNARAERLLYMVQNGVPVYGNAE